MYQVNITKSAKKQLMQLPAKLQIKMNLSISYLKNWEGDIKKLHYLNNGYRLKVGKYRVIFKLENGIIHIIEIDDRRDAYKI